MFLDSSSLLGNKHDSVIGDNFIRSLQDYANIMPAIDSAKKHIDAY